MDAEMYERALRRTDAVVANTRVKQFDTPTPCGDWNVRQLLDHLIGGTAAYAIGSTGASHPPEGTDHIGDDHVASFRIAASNALQAFKRSNIKEKSFKMPWGDTPGPVALGLAISEAAVHGWDLAQATGQPAEIDEDVAQAVYEMTSSMMEPKGDYPRGASFGDPVDVPEDASFSDKAVAYLGRHPFTR